MNSRLGPSQPSFGMPWEPQFWDTERWRPQAVFRRCRAWIAATRRRRWTAWILITLFVLFVFPGPINAVSTAQSGTLALATAPNSATSWMNIKDTSGVNISNYMFVTDRGGLLNPGNYGLWLFISLICEIVLVAVTAAIWLPNQTLGFGWLNLFSVPLKAMAESLTATIATPIVMVTFATVGAFFVAVFTVRAHYAKATTQVVTVLAVAVLSPLVLADPLAEILSDHGLLAQGRDVGLSVAAGLNGDGNPDPNKLLATMSAQNADNFGRYTLQVWNYGHVVDSRPSCKAAWSAGMMAGDEERVKNGLKACGDTAAYAATENPSVGQIGAGLLLLLCAIIYLVFAAYLSLKIIWAALDAIYYGFMTIVGFAAGGYVYGPTQTFTVRCGLHGVVSGCKMCLFVIYASFYMLFMGALFRSANGHIMVVFVTAPVVGIVAVFQLRKFGQGLDSANEWVVNRVATAIQDGGSAQGAGGGSALGMGNAGAGNSMSGLGLFAAASTISNSPIASWLALGVRNPLQYGARADEQARRLSTGVAREFPDEFGNSYYDRRSLGEYARMGVQASESPRRSRRAAAYAAESLSEVTGANSIAAGLRLIGFRWRRAQRAAQVQADILAHADAEPLASEHLARVLAAHKHFEGEHDPVWRTARLDGLMANISRYRFHNRGGVSLPPEIAALGTRYVEGAFDDLHFVRNLRRVAEGDEDANPITYTAGGTDYELTTREAQRLQQWISNEHALRVRAAAQWVDENPDDFQRVRRLREEINRAAATNHIESNRPRTGAVSLAPPHESDADPLVDIPVGILRDLRNN